ncbi:MAG TPA: YqgE/AlgH family protein, partial [Candidatus Marinimicrobia bacterium]|nr:YqgE/AlgH family protein [Candidatus Neomarinimicrobiota bacterium]
MSSLKNQIIISMPHMQDPYFGRAVVFICEHNKDG